MNYTQSFEEFSKGLSTTDLALYAGVGIVAWILLKDKLNPVTQIVKKLVDSFKAKVTTTIPKNPVPSLADLTLVAPQVLPSTVKENNDLFFELVSSWKQTRDLAVRSGCEKAVKVADQMFPYLSPEVCSEKGDTNAV